jgi:hypothetical protein
LLQGRCMLTCYAHYNRGIIMSCHGNPARAVHCGNQVDMKMFAERDAGLNILGTDENCARVYRASKLRSGN